MELKEVFKANDIRGVYGRVLNDKLAYMVGRAIVRYFNCKKIFVGRDMRLSSPALFKALCKGLVESGIDVIDIGLVDTPSLYYATGRYKKHGIMITASHNPANYNGIKIVRAGALAMSKDSGLNEIEEIIKRGEFSVGKKKGKVVRKDISKEYKNYVLSYVNCMKIRNVKVVVDAGNGMAGKVVPLVYRGLDIKAVPLFFSLDGRFPNHVPNPILRKNVVDLMRKVKDVKADLGIAFDGDMDRVAFVDEKGRFVNTSIIGALLAQHLLKRSRGKNIGILFTAATSRILRDIVLQNGGKPKLERVGHAYMKERMRKENALFGMEHSAHYYYRNNFHADSGLITSLLVLEIFSEAKKKGMKFSDLLSEFDKYSQADEVSIVLKDDENILEKIERYYSLKGELKKIYHFDGLFIEFKDYWFSVRKSNTEPLLRINLEARNRKVMKEKLSEVLRVVRKNSQRV